ncbi:hypothetical protein V1509DRAFT_566241 [Lipomyces kononenkoae]
MAEFDAAIALLGLVDPKDEKSSDSDGASGNDQDKTDNKPQKERENNKVSSNSEELKTVKTDRSKPEASDSGTSNMASNQGMNNHKEQDGASNGSSQAAEQNASASGTDHSQGHPKPLESGSQQGESTPPKSSQSSSSDWDGLPQDKKFESPHLQQPPQQSGEYQHRQMPAGQQQQQQPSFSHSPQLQQQQQHLPLPQAQAQYQYSAQQQSSAQSQQSQPESPPKNSQSPAYSTQPSSSNPPPRLPPISQISQPPTPSPHQPYQEHNSRTGYQDHATYSPYQQHASGARTLSYQQSEQHPTGYTSASQPGQPAFAQGTPQGGPGSGRTPSYFSYRDLNEQYNAVGVQGSVPTPQNGYQQYSAPIDPALGGHSVPPVQPEPEGFPKERYYPPTIQPNGVPPAQRRATSTPSNPPAAMNSSVWNAIGSSGGESISSAILAPYINERNHTHANFATGDFLEATICSSILE